MLLKLKYYYYYYYYYYYLTRVTINSFSAKKPVALRFQIELEFGNVGFLRREEKLEDPEKNPWSKDKNQQQTQPTYAPGLGIESGSHWLEASALITAPSLLPFVQVLESQLTPTLG